MSITCFNMTVYCTVQDLHVDSKNRLCCTLVILYVHMRWSDNRRQSQGCTQGEGCHPAASPPLPTRQVKIYMTGFLRHNINHSTCCGVREKTKKMQQLDDLTVTFTVFTPYKSAPHSRYQPHPVEAAQHNTCTNIRLVLLKMGIMMPETC